MSLVRAIILNWNGIADTRSCLKSLGRVDPEKMAVTVVDNNSANGEAAAIAAEFPWAQVIALPENAGFTGGNNAILSRAAEYPADYYLLLNNDTIISAETIAALADALDADPACGIAGPVVRNGDGSVQSAGASINLFTGSTHLRAAIPGAPSHVDMVSGCCFLIRREVIETIGGLEPSYFAYYEETEYCVRAKRNGGFATILVPGAEMTHLSGKSSTSAFQERSLIANRLRFVARNGSPFQRVTAALYTFGFYLWARSARLIASGKRSSLAPLWQGARAGLGFLLRPPT